MNILIIGASHGNELLGTKLYERLLQTRSPLLEHVDFIVGNPRAFAGNKRYIECDLNRSYSGTSDTYEARRSNQIKQHIERTKPDIVLDMHTTTCDQPPCLIIGEDVTSEAMRRFLGASHIDKLLEVQPLGDILSLGNFIVGYEVPDRLVSTELLDEITADIQRFMTSKHIYTKKQLYKMVGKLYKKDVPGKDARTLVNFKEHALGFVPVLIGEEAYKDTDYLGFKALPARDVDMTLGD